MIKKNPYKSFAVFFACFTLLFSSCGVKFPTLNHEIKEHRLSVETLPSKTTYYVGDVLSLAGLKVIDSETQEEVKDYITNPNSGYVFVTADVGNKIIEISKEQYKGISFIVEVLLNQLQEYINAAITSLNEHFNDIDFSQYSSSGVEELNHIYNDGKTAINAASSKDEVDVILEDIINDLDNVPVAPSNIFVTSIELVSFPIKRTFLVGDELDLTGLTIQANYSNNEKILTNYFLFDAVDMNVAGTKEVNICYGDFSLSLEILVVEKTSGIKSLDIYATNDIHGQIEQQNDRASIGALMTYLKDKSDSENTLLLDQGDTWQGSIYSNYNYGALITDLMNYVQFDARTVGNHDFDWGSQYVESNFERQYDYYRTPVLAANVYDFDFTTKLVGENQKSNMGYKSISYVLENGLKVGIVGCIGQKQITSISSLYTMDIAFLDHISIIKEEAIKLRNEGCDIVISSNHTGQEELLGNGLENYVDLVLCAHTHQNEETMENGLYYAQFGAYNKFVGHINIEFDSDTKQLTYNTKEGVSASLINSLTPSIDTTINEIINEYNSECDEVANEVIVNNASGSFYSSEELPNMMCKAMYEQAVLEGYDVDLAYCNNARASLYDSTWTYADIYQAFPFDNMICIIEVSYSELRNEISRYNFIYRSPQFDGVVSRNKTYKVACLDYLAYHTNSSRNYDYFPDNNGETIGQLENNYRIVLLNWLLRNGSNKGNPIYSHDYSSSLTCFDRSFSFQ